MKAGDAEAMGEWNGEGSGRAQGVAIATVVIEGEDAAMPGQQEGREFKCGDECTGGDAVDIDAEAKVGMTVERK
ncbi:hypothetical protein FRC08_010993, partial [Ceratobasidium sp. 394]